MKVTEGTDYLPGSPEKVALLQARYAAGVDMWHPDDRPDNGDVNHSGGGCHRDGTSVKDYIWVKHEYRIHTRNRSGFLPDANGTHLECVQ